MAENLIGFFSRSTRVEGRDVDRHRVAKSGGRALPRAQHLCKSSSPPWVARQTSRWPSIFSDHRSGNHTI
jgi:hypothetical protein